VPRPERDADQEVIAGCDRKLANYRRLLDASTDPRVVAGWIAEVTAQRAAAQVRRCQRPASAGRTRLTKPQMRELVSAIGDLGAALRRAGAKPAKMALNERLGTRLTYHPGPERRPRGSGRPAGRRRHRVCARGAILTRCLQACAGRRMVSSTLGSTSKFSAHCGRAANLIGGRFFQEVQSGARLRNLRRQEGP
jgi:hypothetical protein